MVTVFFFRYIASALFILAVTNITACSDSCVDLSQEICACEPSQTAQTACLNRLDTRTSLRDATEEELERCTQLLDTCTCDALARGDYAACGLAE